MMVMMLLFTAAVVFSREFPFTASFAFTVVVEPVALWIAAFTRVFAFIAVELLVAVGRGVLDAVPAVSLPLIVLPAHHSVVALVFAVALVLPLYSVEALIVLAVAVPVFGLEAFGPSTLVIPVPVFGLEPFGPSTLVVPVTRLLLVAFGVETFGATVEPFYLRSVEPVAKHPVSGWPLVDEPVIAVAVEDRSGLDHDAVGGVERPRVAVVVELAAGGRVEEATGVAVFGVVAGVALLHDVFAREAVVLIAALIGRTVVSVATVVKTGQGLRAMLGRTSVRFHLVVRSAVAFTAVPEELRDGQWVSIVAPAVPILDGTVALPTAQGHGAAVTVEAVSALGSGRTTVVAGHDDTWIR